VDLMAALICPFNGVVEWKVVTTRRSTKTRVMSPAGARRKGKHAKHGKWRRAGLNKVFSERRKVKIVTERQRWTKYSDTLHIITLSLSHFKFMSLQILEFVCTLDKRVKCTKS